MAKKKVDESAELAGAMIQALEASKARNDGSYPPTLRALVELTGKSPAPETILKAAGKKTFSALAVVPEKVDKKPSLDSPVYFKGDAPPKKKPASKPRPKPKPQPDAELARKLLLLLDHQREHDPRAYPPTLRRLADLCGLTGSETPFIKAVGSKAFTETALVASKVGTKPALDAPVLLKKDNAGHPAVLAALLTFALRPIVSLTKGKSTETDAFDLGEVTKKLVQPLQASFREAVERGLDAKTLPPGIGWLPIKGKTFLFLVASVRNGAEKAPVAPPPLPLQGSNHHPVAVEREFAAAFRQAFDQLDRRNGATNFVTLADLRRALADFGREEFDEALNVLRRNGEFSLDSHEGLHGTLSPEQREAGVREAGSLLVYASRR